MLVYLVFIVCIHGIDFYFTYDYVKVTYYVNGLA